MAYPGIKQRLPTIRITKKFRFELSHALSGHKGACRNVHGHSYQLSVTIAGKPIADPTDAADGMVMDFAQLSEIVKTNILEVFDHALALNRTDAKRFPGIDESTRVVYLPFAPTCEMLLIHFCKIISAHLPEPVKLHAVRLDETATSYAEWHCDDNL